jgi:hypothetical protein
MPPSSLASRRPSCRTYRHRATCLIADADRGVPGARRPQDLAGSRLGRPRHGAHDAASTGPKTNRPGGRAPKRDLVSREARSGDRASVLECVLLERCRHAMVLAPPRPNLRLLTHSRENADFLVVLPHHPHGRPLWCPKAGFPRCLEVPCLMRRRWCCRTPARAKAPATERPAVA